MKYIIKCTVEQEKAKGFSVDVELTKEENATLEALAQSEGVSLPDLIKGILQGKKTLTTGKHE